MLSLTPPRLLHVTTVEVTLRAFLAPVARHFRGLGWQVEAAASGAKGSLGGMLDDAYDALYDLPLSRNPLDPRSPSAGVADLRRVLIEGKYDLVHVMTPIAGLVARVAARTLPPRRRPRVVYVAHGFHFYEGGRPLLNAAYRAMESAAARWTDYLGVVNHEDAEAVRRGRWVPPDRMFWQPGVGVDFSRFEVERSAKAFTRTRDALGIATDDPVFLCVAEFTTRKRHADLIRAFAGMEGNKSHLYLAGIGPLLEECRAMTVELGVDERVHFLGFRRDVPALMAAANAVVLVSEQEGLPTCVIEALMLGAAVIGSDIRGTRDLLADTGNPLIPLGDVPALSQALETATGEPPAALQPRHYSNVERYALDHVLRVHEEIYGAALAGRPVPDPLRPFPLPAVSHG